MIDRRHLIAGAAVASAMAPLAQSAPMTPIARLYALWQAIEAEYHPDDAAYKAGQIDGDELETRHAPRYARQDALEAQMQGEDCQTLHDLALKISVAAYYGWERDAPREDVAREAARLLA